MINSKEKFYIKNKYIWPQIANEIIKKTEFSIEKNDLSLINEGIEEGYGQIVELNKELGLKLQYHGRFESFLIGIGINPENSHQPDLKLVRIDSQVESTHGERKSIFFQPKKINGTHIHWYNYFYPMLINKKNIDDGGVSEKDYSLFLIDFLKDKNLNMNQEEFRHICPYYKINELCKKLKLTKGKLRIDLDVSINAKLKKDPKHILTQILNKEIFPKII